MTVADKIAAFVARRSDLTEAKLSEEIFGSDGYQQKVNSTCRRMIREGRLERHGKGGPADPFTYTLKGS